MDDVIGKEFELFRSKWVVAAETNDGFLCKYQGEGRYGTPGQTLDGLVNPELTLSEENVRSLLSCGEKLENGEQLRTPWLASLKPGDEIHMPHTEYEGYSRLRVTKVHGDAVWASEVALLGRKTNDNSAFLERYGSGVGGEWTPNLEMIVESPTFIPSSSARITIPLDEADVLVDEAAMEQASIKAAAESQARAKASTQSGEVRRKWFDQIAKTPEYKKLNGMEKLVVTMDNGTPLDWNKLLLPLSILEWPEAAQANYDLADDEFPVTSAVAELAEAIENDNGQLTMTSPDGRVQHIYTTTNGVGEDWEGMLQSYAASILLDDAYRELLGIASVEYQA